MLSRRIATEVENRLSRSVRMWILTAGLNNPPLMRKKTHAFVANAKPNERLIYKSWAGFFCWTVVTTMSPVLVFDDIFATLQVEYN